MIYTHSSGFGNAFGQGVSGLHNSTRATVEAASDLVRAGTVDRASTTTTDIVEPLVKIRQQQHVFDAAAKVVDVADQALGALIDTKA